MDQTFEVEIDNETNSGYYFPPIGRPIRGRFDFTRIPEPLDRAKSRDFPRGIPGELLRIDVASGTAELVEPLYDHAHRDARAKIEARKMKLQDETQTFPSIHLPTWLFWIKAAVDSGLARVVKGKLPKIEGEPDKTILTRATANKTDAMLAQLSAQNERLTVAFEKMAASMERLAKK